MRFRQRLAAFAGFAFSSPFATMIFARTTWRALGNPPSNDPFAWREVITGAVCERLAQVGTDKTRQDAPRFVKHLSRVYRDAGKTTPPAQDALAFTHREIDRLTRNPADMGARQ